MKIAAASILLWLPLMLFPQRTKEQPRRNALEEIQIRHAAEPRPLLVFITADWCSYCKLMKKKVFSNPEVTKKLQADFYFAELNGEYTEPIVWQGQTYRYVPNGPCTGTHELVQHLGAVNGKLTYPTLVVLDKNNGVLFRYGGLLTASEIVALWEKVKS